MTWWYDDMVIWWYDDMVTWWYDAMMIWWYDDAIYDGLMIWWYDDLERKQCVAWNKRNVLLGTQGMSCLKHKECPAWNTRNVLLGTQGMSCLEHTECDAWNTRNVFFENDKTFPPMPMSNCEWFYIKINFLQPHVMPAFNEIEQDGLAGLLEL